MSLTRLAGGRLQPDSATSPHRHTYSTRIRGDWQYPDHQDSGHQDGATEEIRTPDLRITSALLYQLSYGGSPIA